MPRTAILVTALSLALAGCNAQGYGPKQGLGTIVGAASGGLLGAQIGGGSGQLAATALGTLAGAMLGNSVGSSLDRADRLYASRAQHQALEYSAVGYETPWENPDSGNYGKFKPTQTYQAPDGRYCREYQQTVVIGGRRRSAFGQACRQPDGSWEIG